MKQLLNSAFVYVGYEEFCRSRRVLSSLGVYRKIPKALLRGLYSAGVGGGVGEGGLSTEGKFRFKVYWASLIFGRKFTVFPLFYFVFEGNFQVQAPRGGLIFGGAVSIKHGLRTGYKKGTRYKMWTPD